MRWAKDHPHKTRSFFGNRNWFENILKNISDVHAYKPNSNVNKVTNRITAHLWKLLQEKCLCINSQNVQLC